MLAAALAALVVVASPDDEGGPPGDGATTPRRGAEPPPVALPPPADRPLAIGLTESNASLLWSRQARPDLDPRLAPWRDRIEALRPAYYRLLVDWSKLQPSPDRPADLARREDGCLRGLAPCGPFSGIHDVLRAVRTQQQAHGGWEVLVTIYGVPEWAAIAAQGCERSTEQPRSRPITRRGLRAYRRLVGDLAGLGRRTGVALRWWSPWNEPNQPFFISPQRPRCDPDAPSAATRVYARLVRAARAELRSAGGDRRLVLGEMAAVDGPNPNVTGIAELIRELPEDVVCAGAVWAQHVYAEAGETEPDRGAVGRLDRALDRRPCTRGTPIWVTETGVGVTRSGDQRDTSRADLLAGCRAQAAALTRWARDPRVEAAFQYTFREDTAFPVGLADARLERVYPVYDLWRAWGRGRSASAAACG